MLLRMREMDQAAPTESRRAGTLPRAFLIGLFVGATAQFLRQIVGPLMAVGGGIAPWVTIGFILAIWETRGRPFRRASLLGVKTIAAYLLAWLLSYHGLFAVRESIGVFAAWREALPWLVIAGPMSVFLGLAAARSHKPGTLGDVCLGATSCMVAARDHRELAARVVVQRHCCDTYRYPRLVAVCRRRQARCGLG
jgi:hypothetical protein